MIVTISGVDSAGKTTQLELLERWLADHGHRPHAFWYRPGYSAELDWLRRTVRRMRPGALPHTSTDPDAHRRAFASPRVRRTWLAVAVADAALQYGLKVRAMSASGQVVLCDRYVEDGLMDLIFRFPELERAARLGFRGVQGVAPRPDLSLLLMLPHEIMVARMEAKDEPFPDPPAVRDARFERYQALASSGRYVVVDANRSRDRIHAEIASHVASALEADR